MFKRILIVFAILAVLGSAFWWFYGPQTVLALEAHSIGWKNPALNLTPTELPEPWVSGKPMNKLSYLGYEFAFPWTDVDEQNSPVNGNSVTIHFKSGNQLFFSVSPAMQLVNSVLSSADTEGIFPQILGEQAIESDYTLARRVLETTPSQITLSTPRRDAVGKLSTLTVKAMVMLPADSGLFTYRLKGYRCIQYGKPEARPRTFYVHMYSTDHSFTFGFTQVPGSNAPALSQADVDSILSTVRKVH